ncbi:MAG: pre-peptidase C-terminal domain-containing protein, partial [Gemmatimonadetes bacterium]|nr:pre-peptidase C-terminal domain-containing protein [Gemmatimonadota bacterium]
QINLAWTDNASNETGFHIERCTGAGCTVFSEIATVGANVMSYQNTGLAAGTTYRYQVRAYNASGNSTYAGPASATTAAAVPLQNGVTVSDLAGAAGSETYYVIDVPAAQSQLTVTIAGPFGGDADLYVRAGSVPTQSTYDCRPYVGGNNEQCTFPSPAASTWHIMIRGFSDYSGVSLTATYTP